MSSQNLFSTPEPHTLTMLAQRGCELLRKQTLRLASEVFHGVSILLADTRENGAPIECKWPEMQAHDGG